MNPLDQLRDIHLPPPVSWWPPAPGWWVVTALVFASCLLLVYLLRMRWQRRLYRREAEATLGQLRKQFDQHGNKQRYLNDLLGLLRQVVRTSHPDKHWESLSTDELIEQLSSDKLNINQEDKINYESVLYSRDGTVSDTLIDQTEVFITGWVKHHKETGRC